MIFPKNSRGRGQWKENETWKDLNIETKTVLHLHSSNDPTMKAVAQIHEQRKEKRRRSIMKDAGKYTNNTKYKNV